ncbi:hypothetical protein PSTT_01376, partial [Puccinia striiformis]
ISSSQSIHDWVIIELGVPSGTIVGFDIDTTLFNGNEAPACSVYGLDRLHPAPSSPDDPEWRELLPVVQLGPSARHLFKIPETEKGYRYLKLNILPDGTKLSLKFFEGLLDLECMVTRSQSFLEEDVTWLQSYSELESSLHLINTTASARTSSYLGVVLKVWTGLETKRSRKPGHSDFVIIKLADGGFLDYAEIDTNYFIGNFPQMVDLYATVSDQIVPDPSSEWTEILEKSKLGPHQQQSFQLSRPQEKFTHVRMTIYPDGGVKRIRLFGRRTETIDDNAELSTPSDQVEKEAIPKSAGMEKTKKRIPILPLNRSAFEPYGAVIESHLDSRASSNEIRSKVVNFGTAMKSDHVARLETAISSENPVAVPNLCLFSCQPWSADSVSSNHLEWRLKGLERHQFSSQTFIPIATHTRTADQTEQDQFNSQPEGLYLIVVALDNNGKPNLDSLRAFLGKKSQGISYYQNIWHAPLIAINNRMEFVCWIYETGDPEIDCELLEIDGIVCELDKSKSTL